MKYNINFGFFIKNTPIKIKKLSPNINYDKIKNNFNFIFTTKPLTIGCNFVFTGEIISYAKKITGTTKVIAVIGGFHLRTGSVKEMFNVHKFFKNEKIDLIYGCHCTGVWGRLWIPLNIPPICGNLHSIGKKSYPLLLHCLRNN